MAKNLTTSSLISVVLGDEVPSAKLGEQANEEARAADDLRKSRRGKDFIVRLLRWLNDRFRLGGLLFWYGEPSGEQTDGKDSCCQEEWGTWNVQ